MDIFERILLLFKDIINIILKIYYINHYAWPHPPPDMLPYTMRVLF
jgi:hypothetical protein